jgi:hypothetical protein
MAVFSYVTGSNNSQSFLISSYADEIISSYANVLISEFEIKIITRSFKFSSNLNEEFISSYNESSRVDYLEITYGSITDSITDSEDYGYITGDIITYDQIENFGTITINRTQTPYGRLHVFQEFSDDSLSRVSVGGVRFALYGRANYEVIFNPLNRAFEIEGSADVPFTKSYVGKGQFTSFVGAADSVGFNPPESALLFRFQGKAETEVIFNERSRILYFDSATEVSKTNNYNETSVVTFSSTDYGFISEVESLYENYGLISEDEDFANWEREDFGFITENETRLPYGKTEFISYTTESTTNPHVGSGSTKIYGEGLGKSTPRQNGEGCITLSGTSVDRFRLRYFGSGSAFTFVSGSETTKVETEQEGTIRFTGEAVERYTKGNYNGQSNKDIAIKGVAICEVIFNPIDRFARFLNLEINSRTYSYNESSVVNLEGIDYGFISESPTLFGDYGNITDLAYYPWEEDDYGFITDNTVNLPFGKATFISGTTESNTENYVGSGSVYITANAKIFVLPKHTGSGYAQFSGEAVEKNTEDYVGSGSIFTFVSFTEASSTAETSKELFQFSGSATEKFGKGLYTGSGSIFAFSSTTESESNTQESKGLFKFYGSATDSNTENYVGSGSLFSFSTNKERVTYSYNQSSVYTFESLDYGFISESPTLFGDYGSITENPFVPYPENSDYGFITDNQTRIPYGSLNISGTLDSIKIRLNYFGSGSINIDGNAEYAYTPEETGTGLFNITSNPIIKISLLHVGSGSLFSFVGGDESATLAPENGSGIISIFGSAVERNTEPYFGTGTLFGLSSTTEAYSFVPTTEGLFRISGSAAESTTPTTEIGSGSIFTFVSATETFAINPPDQTTLFSLSGSAVERNTESYFGTGTLFGFSSTTDSAILAESGSGLFRISGSAAESTTPTTEIGSGSIFTFVSATETFAINPPDETTLFTLFGSAVERNTESYFGTGTLFGFSSTTDSAILSESGTGLFKFYGSATDSNTESYVGTGVAFAFLEGVQLDSSGKIRYVSGQESTTSIPSTFGTLFSVSGEVRIFFEYRETGSGVVQFGGAGFAQPSAKHFGSGQIKVIGNTTESTKVDRSGSGSIFGFVSATESSVVNPPESTELFRISGTSTERYGTASDTIAEIAINGSARIRRVPSVISKGKLTLSGYGEESFVLAPYSGSGRISTIGSSSDYRTVINPPEVGTIVLFRGTAITRGIINYTGSGSIFTFVSSTKTKSSTEKSEELFRITGSAIEKNTESYIGVGNLFEFSQRPIIDSNGKVSYVAADESSTGVPPTQIAETRFFGSADVRKTPSYVGSGSIFGFISKTESFGANPPESTELFKISGNSIEKNTEAYSGTGSIFSFASSTESISIRTKEPTSLFRISGGASKFSITRGRYVGSGSIFTFISSSESTLVSPQSSGLFDISGSARIRSIKSEFGTGSIFAFSSSTEALLKKYPDSVGLFNITGFAFESFATSTYLGDSQTIIRGSSVDRKTDYIAPKPVRLYII